MVLLLLFHGLAVGDTIAATGRIDAGAFRRMNGGRDFLGGAQKFRETDAFFSDTVDGNIIDCLLQTACVRVEGVEVLTDLTRGAVFTLEELEGIGFLRSQRKLIVLGSCKGAEVRGVDGEPLSLLGENDQQVAELLGELTASN